MSRSFLYALAFLALMVLTNAKHLIVFKHGKTITKSATLAKWITHFSVQTLRSEKSNSTAADEVPSEIPIQSIGNFQWSHGDFEDSDLAELRKLPEIAYIEPDVQVKAYEVQNKPPSWGIDRIDQQKGTDGKYHYPESAGEGVTIYSVDTGTNIDHEEFEGRATNGPVFNGDNAPDDVNGHGTFVAAVAVGKNFGVAKKAHLVSLKALDADGYGSLSNVLQAVDWIVQEHKKNPKQKSVINLSLGAIYSQVANDAIEEAIKLGIHFSIAAGNDSDDACNYSPSSVKSALVVGATTSKDEVTSFSNTGPCVSIYAPGESIKSAWKDGPKSTHTLSGTSMASPHVAGVIALVLGEHNMDPYSMAQMIKNQTIQLQPKKNGKSTLVLSSGNGLPLLYLSPSVTGEADTSDVQRSLPYLWRFLVFTFILCYWN
ncbi:hypothetical protein K7432_012292 [Basidiobolus ranarum]|uniref:Peptidase S8/S53 domain-containing protein n=1 Tax=Basidiobolus ranarum TaxID=34480 RepID=A0ABR2WL55_9FUNG